MFGLCSRDNVVVQKNTVNNDGVFVCKMRYVHCFLGFRESNLGICAVKYCNMFLEP